MHIKNLQNLSCFIFLFISSLIFAQTKKELEKIFKNSINQTIKPKIRVGENSWKIFLDKNTIILYETKFDSYANCCRYDEWTFYKKNKFIKSESYMCAEPPYTKATTEHDWYELEYIEKDNLILVIKNQSKTESFIVKEILKRKDNLHIIRLVKN